MVVTEMSDGVIEKTKLDRCISKVTKGNKILESLLSRNNANSSELSSTACYGRFPTDRTHANEIILKFWPRMRQSKQRTSHE
jgi:hypothetical protein